MNRNYSINLLVLFALAILTFAGGCDESTAEPTDLSYDYSHFPLELDRPLIYRVDSIVLVPTVGGIRYDTTTSQLRETLVETFVGADGQEVYRGERWTRPTEDDEWEPAGSFTQWRTRSAAFREDDNLVFNSLIFPIDVGTSWDAHAAFDDQRFFTVGGEFVQVYRGWRSRYLGVRETAILPTGVSFDEVLLVEMANDTNLIDLRAATATYAPGFGLVARTIDARSTQCQVCCGGDTAPCADLPWDDKAEKGFLLRQYFIRRD